MDKYSSAIYVCGVPIARLHAQLLSMLKEIDVVANSNGVKYSLAEGTLLGAVRSSGFIPWDDDLDIMMTRSNYNQFLKSASNHLPDYLIIEDPIANPRYPLHIAKVMDSRTIFLDPAYENQSCGTGVYIDIFIYDRTHPLFYRLQYLISALILNARWKKLRFPRSAKFQPVELIIRVLSLLPETLLSRLALSVQTLFNRFPTGYYGDLCYGGQPSHLFEEAYLHRITKILFEGEHFSCIETPEYYLSRRYGDYMTLPPPHLRYPAHSPVLLSLPDDE